MTAISEEQFARVGDLDLCYQTFGAEDDPPLLMVMGLGAQTVVVGRRAVRDARRPRSAGDPLR